MTLTRSRRLVTGCQYQVWQEKLLKRGHVFTRLPEQGKDAVEEYLADLSKANPGEALQDRLATLRAAEVGSPIDHADLIEISKHLTQRGTESKEALTERWRLDVLLRGVAIYKPPPRPKPEPSSEYKALMKRLREEQERKQYERMISPEASAGSFVRHNTTTSTPFHPAISHGQAPPEEFDEITYADVNRQLTLILNVLVSIIACSVAIWIAARHWSVPQRLGLSMSGSGLVAVAEVTIYFGYLRRIKEAKTEEKRRVETKEIIETWVADQPSSATKHTTEEGLRFRKGKHR